MRKDRMQSVSVNEIQREELFKAWDDFDKKIARESKGVDISQITVDELYSSHMKKRPDVLRLELSLDMYSVDEEEMDTLRKYGKVDRGIIREVLVPASMTLHALHYVIMCAFGWQNSHLHHFRLPAQVFQEITGGKNKPNPDDHVVHDGLYTNWVRLCGLYFRFPCNDFEDLYWDDDYEEGKNFDTWLKHKYMGPYRYNGNWERYYYAHETAKSVIAKNPEICVPMPFDEWYRLKEQGKDPESVEDRIVPIGEASIRDMEQGFEGRLDELIERLPLVEILRPEKSKKYGDLKTRIAFLSRRQEKEEDELPAIPVTDMIRYEYDYGDAWEVNIRITDCYYTMNRYEIVEAAGLKGGIAMINNEQHLKENRVYDMNNQRICDEYADKIKQVGHYEKPECLSADGLNLMDDVGGIHGYVRFLDTIHGYDPEEKEELREWARYMGWTGRMKKPEKML